MPDIEPIAESLYGAYVEMISTLPPKPWSDVPEGGKRVYRRMAEAAVQGLQLTEELGCSMYPADGPTTTGYTPEEWQAVFQRATFKPVGWLRLTSPWVRCEESQ